MNELEKLAEQWEQIKAAGVLEVPLHILENDDEV